MLRSIRNLEGVAVGATDGAIGHVKDFFFDDRAWVVRYLVVDAGAWLSSRKVLISPIAVARPAWSEGLLHVSMTKEQIKNSPHVDTEMPVSRQYEAEYARYYDYPYYWGGEGYWGGGMYPYLLMPGYAGFGPGHVVRPEGERAGAQVEPLQYQKGDPHLRSCRAVTKYRVHASDGDIGHVDGQLVDDETWAIRYLIVNTSNWWLGHKVLVAPPWIEDINWFDSKISVRMTRQAIKEAPEWDPITLLDRSKEAGLYRHYGHDGYWAEEARRQAELARI